MACQAQLSQAKLICVAHYPRSHFAPIACTHRPPALQINAVGDAVNRTVHHQRVNQALVIAARRSCEVARSTSPGERMSAGNSLFVCLVDSLPRGLINKAGKTIKSPTRAAASSKTVIHAKADVGTNVLKPKIAIPLPQIMVV